MSLFSYDFLLNKVLYLMFKKKKFDREDIIIFTCLNKLFIFSKNYVYCKNKKCLSKEFVTFKQFFFI